MIVHSVNIMVFTLCVLVGITIWWIMTYDGRNGI